MDMKRYKKTRYQNIYKSIKNQNYIIVIPGTRTTISKDEKQNKIFDIDMAIKLRDNKKIRITKKSQTNTYTYEHIWQYYISYCENNLSYNTCKKKKLLYNAYIKDIKDIKISKLTKQDIIKFISNLSTTTKQKNVILKQIKAFLNWCVDKEYIVFNPAITISKQKEEKKEMKYWLPGHLKAILNVLNEDIANGSDDTKRVAYVTKMIILLGFNLGDRLGETRALRFCDISEEYKTITISHSIDYDPKSKTFIKDTKNEHSKRTIDVSDKLLKEINDYRCFLTNTLRLDIKKDSMLFINPVTNKPYSDVALRKHFNHYIDKANVPKIRMYDLRHTFVTTMMTEGWEMYAISKRIGHNNINTTINTYGHISEKVRKGMAETTDKYY